MAARFDDVDRLEGRSMERLIGIASHRPDTDLSQRPDPHALC